MTREREVGTVGWSFKGDERQKLRQSIIWPLCIPVSCILRFFIFFYYFCNHTLFFANVE